MGYRAYPEMRNSGAEWLGNVPKHWQLSRLKFQVSIVGGGTPNTAKPEYWGGTIPWVSPKDMKAPSISDTQDYLTELGLRDSATCLVQPDSVLMVVRSGILRHSIPVARNTCSVALNQDMKALIPKLDITSAYLHRLIEGNQKQLLPLWSKSGCTVESIEHSYYANTEVPLPPIEEQKSIARFLDHKTTQIDALIAKKEALLQKLAEKRTALISQAVTQGLNPTVPMKDSGNEWIGKIPAHWETCRVKLAAKLESGHTPSKQVPEYWDDCDIPWVSLNDSKQLAACDYISETAIQINSLGLANSSARLLPQDAVVFTRDATIGLCAITTRPMAVSQHLIAWIPGPDIDALYLLRVFNAMKPFLDSFTFGATIKTIGMSDVKKLVTPVPPLDEQLAITNHIKMKTALLDSQRAKTEVAIDKLKEYRSALITAAVTGKIDVRGVPLPAEVSP